MSGSTLEKALKLAVVTGLRAALGPALYARSANLPSRQNLALAAMGELVFDKVPYAPSRDTLVPLLARGMAGAWVVKQVQDEEEDHDPWLVPLGAAVAMGVAVAAPKIRKILGWTTGIPQPILGLAEDYLALRLGTEAVGMPLQDVGDAAMESVDDLRVRLEDVAQSFEQRSLQSAGAGSM